MKKYARLFKYLGSHSSGIVLYFVFSVLSIAFSLISFSGLPVFLTIIFAKEKMVLVKPNSVFDVLKYINYELGLFIQAHGKDGPVLALGVICLLILISVFLKNFFF